MSEGNGSPFLTPLLSFLSISNVMLHKRNLQKDFNANIFVLETIRMNFILYSRYGLNPITLMLPVN